MGEFNTKFSETSQNITTISFDIVDLRGDVSDLEEDVGLEIMSLNHSINGLDQDISVRLDNLNLTQVRNEYVFLFSLIELVLNMF